MSEYEHNEHLLDEIQRLRESNFHLREDCEKQKQRIKRLEEDLMDAKNKHAALVADVALYEDRGERIKRLEEENDAMRADLLLWRQDKWRE